MTGLETARNLRAGLLGWQAADAEVSTSRLAKAFRDNWDARVGMAKFGGVWSIAKARQNLMHPASGEALRIPREDWSGANVTVEHAVPIKVLYPAFMAADTDDQLQAVIAAYNVAVITLQEDRSLRALGLASAMPEGWQWGDDPFARWSMAGIKVAAD